LATFSERDLCGALLLAISYGQAYGYRMADERVRTARAIKGAAGLD